MIYYGIALVIIYAVYTLLTCRSIKRMHIRHSKEIASFLGIPCAEDGRVSGTVRAANSGGYIVDVHNLDVVLSHDDIKFKPLVGEHISGIFMQQGIHIVLRQAK